MEDIKEVIKDTYGSTALLAEQTIEGANRVAKAFGYSKEELDAIPQGANMGLSCGNPLAIASLKEGEVVVDLGSGGGLDCFLASSKVKESGRVIGVDMTPNMIDLARKNAAKFGKGNVEFRQGDIEALPIEDNSVDCVISNCVINLSTDKQKVFNEIYRVLKPGGRLAVSDICLKKELPAELREAVMAYVGCISGALLVDTYRDMMHKAGFKDVATVDSNADLNAYAMLKDDNSAASCCASVTETEKVVTVEGGGGGGCCGGESGKNSSCIVTTIKNAIGLGGGESGGCCGGGSTCTPSSSSSSSSCCQTAEEPSRSSGGRAGFGEVIDLLKKHDANEYAGSYKIFAIKPTQD